MILHILEKKSNCEFLESFQFIITVCACFCFWDPPPPHRKKKRFIFFVISQRFSLEFLHYLKEKFVCEVSSLEASRKSSNLKMLHVRQKNSADLKSYYDWEELHFIKSSTKYLFYSYISVLLTLTLNILLYLFIYWIA